MKAQRNSTGDNKDMTDSEALSLLSKPESPPLEVDTKAVYFDADVQQADENSEPCQEELAKYFSKSKRRETIAVSHLSPDYRSGGLFSDNYNNIPEISIFRSPTPPLLELSNQLQYKEQYLPRPAVLQVRPQFDRRASDGSATLQDTIARFNFQKSLSKSNNSYIEASGQEDNSNVLGIPEGENGGSESDNEPDPEAVQKYLMSRGARQRHTFTCILEATPEEQDGSFKAFQSSKPRSNVKLSNRDRERGSPVPYLPLSPVPYLPVSPESRRSINSDRRPSDSGLSVHLYQDKRKEDQDLNIKQLRVEHKRLQDQFLNNPVDHSGRGIRRGSQNVSIFRHAYPLYPEGCPCVEAPSILPSLDTEAAGNDHNLLLLHQKQEAQRKNLYNQLIVKRKFLEKQMEAETRELIRRASEGATKLESGVEDFLKSRKENNVVDFLKGENGTMTSNTDESCIPPPASTELQDEMKKLNLKVSSGLSVVAISPDLQLNEPLFEERQRSNTNPTSRDVSFNPSLSSWAGSMDVDEEALSEIQSSNFRYANVQSLFNNTVTPSRNRPRRGSVLPLSPRFGISHSGLPFTPPYANHVLEINNPVSPNGGLLWGGGDNESNEVVTTSIDNENQHQSLNRTLSVDITSSLNINEVVAAVKSCLDARPDVTYSQSDSYFSLYKEGIQMEIEVYPLEQLGCKNGVKLRRVGGDKWAYKKLRDDLLSGLFL